MCILFATHALTLKVTTGHLHFQTKKKKIIQISIQYQFLEITMKV